MNKRGNPTEDGMIMPLFESSFPFIWRYVDVFLEKKMDVLEAMVIRQVCAQSVDVCSVEFVRSSTCIDTYFLFGLFVLITCVI